MTIDKPRILLITSNFPPENGGAQTWSVEVALKLAILTDSFLVIAPYSKNAELFDKTLRFTVSRSLMLQDGFAISGIINAAKAILQFQPDIVIAAHWSAAHIPLRILPQTIPVLIAVHGREVFLKPLRRFPPAQWIYDAIRRFVFQRATSFIAVSSFTADLLYQAGVSRQKISIIANGVDSTFFKPTQSTFRKELGLVGPIILTVARLVPRKGIDQVINSLPFILKKIPDLTYIIAGTGPDRARLEKLALHRGVSKQVIFLGHVANDVLASLYSASDLFIMVPRSDGAEVEGFGLVFLEASACGKPVIGSIEGGVPEAVIDGQTGILVNPRDITAIAGAVVHILSNPKLANTMGRTGRLHAENWASWDRAAKELWPIIISKWQQSKRIYNQDP